MSPRPYRGGVVGPFTFLPRYTRSKSFRFLNRFIRKRSVDLPGLVSYFAMDEVTQSTYDALHKSGPNEARPKQTKKLEA